MRPNPFNIPFRIFLFTTLLALTGVVMVYSSSANYTSIQERKKIAEKQGSEALKDNHSYHSSGKAVRQFIYMGLGLLAMIAAYRIDYNRLKILGPGLLAATFIMLCLVFVDGIGVEIHTCFRWIQLGPIRLQPSEFAKLALVIYMARMLNNHHDKIKSFTHGVLPGLALTGVFATLLVMEPDIGATAVMVMIIFLMWFIGGMRILHLGFLVSATIPAFVMVVLKYPDRVARVLAFLKPTEESILGRGMQLNQSLIAVGSGGPWGLGLGNSMQKHFLTEQFSDFIFAIISEEIGFFGSALIILCFFLLIWEGWRVALRAPDFYASLLASGITLMLAINVSLNLMVVLGLAPTKGLVLPFLSAGGSNLLVTMTSMGILMNIGAYIEREKATSRAPRRRGGAENTRGKKRIKPRKRKFRTV